jgi:hypothetical protein
VRAPAAEQTRVPVYCLVPEAHVHELLAPLRAHYRCDSGVEVIVDRRRHDRPRPQNDRRRPAVPRELTDALPPDLAAHAERLRWEQRIRPVRRRLQDTSLDALLSLVADGDDDAHSEVYWRYGSRVRARLARRSTDPGALDAATRQTFGRVFDRVARANPGSRSFESYVAAVADAVAWEKRGT